LTSRTPSGGSCKIGDRAFAVHYCTDIWEWEYQGHIFHDALDLAEAMLRDCNANCRLVRFYTGKIPDERRWPRIPAPVALARPDCQ
jgi:hypothetical protein